MHITAFFQFRRGFGGDIPSADHLQTGGPENTDHIRPHAGVLMSKHHTLHTVVGHVLRHRGVSLDHAAPEVIAAAFDG